MIRKQPESHPANYSYYNTTSTLGIAASSSGGNWAHNFGFTALYVQIDNLGSAQFWVRLGAPGDLTTGIASTQDILITTCTDHSFLKLSGIPITGVSLFATSTAGAQSVFAVG